MVDQGENRPILDQERFPLPESLHSEELHEWFRGLDGKSQDRFKEELLDWMTKQVEEPRRPWIESTFEAKFLRTDRSLLRAIFGRAQYDRDLERVERNLEAEGYTVEEFERKLQDSTE